MCVIFSALLFGRAASNVLLYVFASVSLLVFLFSSVSHCFSFLLFLLPLAPILKADANGMSYFTVLFFVFVLRMVVSKRTLDKNVFIFLYLFLLCYAFCISGLGQATTIITMILGMLMLYYLRMAEIDIDLAIRSVSLWELYYHLFLRSLKDVFPIVNTFVASSSLRLDSEHYASPFFGTTRKSELLYTGYNNGFGCYTGFDIS